MIKINKKQKVISITCIIVIIIFSIFIIYNIIKIKKNNLNGREYNQINDIVNEIQGEKQKEIKSIVEIKTPDEIIYYKNNEKIIISKESQNFENIIKTNENRSLGELKLLELFVNFDDEKHNFLEYKYLDGYSIYFTIDSNSKNYIWIPNNCKVFFSGAYGFIDSATQLLKYLN